MEYHPNPFIIRTVHEAGTLAALVYDAVRLEKLSSHNLVSDEASCGLECDLAASIIDSGTSVVVILQDGPINKREQ